MDVRIDRVDTEIVVSEGVGPLAPEEVKRLVALVLEQVRREAAERADRRSETVIGNRVFEVPI